MQSHIIGSILSRLVGIVAVIVLLTATADPVPATIKEPALNAELLTAAPEDEIRVIVEFTPRVDLPTLRNMPRPQRRELMATEMKAAAERDQRGVRSLLQSRGVKGTRHLWMINSLAVKAPAKVIQELAAHPEVLSLRIDRKITAAEILLQSFPPPEANINTINANDLWVQGDLGQGAVVAVMDTGADVNHPDLAGTWRGGTNSWFDPYGVHTTPVDSDGHGTGVLGIMVGGGAGGTTIGTAPGAKWIAAKMFDDTGNTFDSVIHQVFQWFLDPDGNPATDDAPDVVNASWGFQNLAGICVNTYQPDIDALNAAGIAVVFAAGNTGPGAATSISPANNAGAIAVGSVDDLNVIDPTSARGTSTCDNRVYPDVVAPGDTIKTADLSFGGFPFYISGTGTSYSAPHAAGVIALLRSAFPNATLDQLKSALTGSAADLGAVGPDDVYGNGLVNAAAAYASLGAPCIRPQVDFTAAPFPAAANQLITFTSSVSGGTQPYSYAWDFNGDGVTRLHRRRVLPHLRECLQRLGEPHGYGCQRMRVIHRHCRRLGGLHTHSRHLHVQSGVARDRPTGEFHEQRYRRDSTVRLRMGPERGRAYRLHHRRLHHDLSCGLQRQRGAQSDGSLWVPGRRLHGPGFRGGCSYILRWWGRRRGRWMLPVRCRS